MILSLLFAALGGLCTALIYGLYPALSLLWCIPIWLGGYVATALLYLLVLFSAVALLPQKDPSPATRRITHIFVRLTISWVLSLLGYRIRVQGADKLPAVPFLLVSNHRSAFDPLCAIATLHRDLVFVAKPSVLRIPLIGHLMQKVNFMAIDRDNARNAVTTIKLAAHRIADVGFSVGIYPEGTRSKDGSLLPFHAGSFKIAALSACPVAVATIRYRKAGLWGKRVDLHIVDVMGTDYVAATTTAAMAERARNAIASDLEV